MSKKTYTTTSRKLWCIPLNTEIDGVLYEGANFKWLTIGARAFGTKVNNPHLSWREVAEVVSPLGKVLHGQTVKEHAMRYVQKVWLGEGRLVKLMQRGVAK
jgi:hypothetical protein